MAKTSKYCAAYMIPRLRAFPGWKVPEKNTRKEKPGDAKDAPPMSREAKEKEAPAVPRVLTEKDYLFVHDSYVVTDGTYLDENVVMSAEEVTPEWIEYLKTELNFKPTPAEPKIIPKVEEPPKT